MTLITQCPHCGKRLSPGETIERFCETCRRPASLHPNMYPRLIGSNDERLSGMVRRHFALKDRKAGDAGEKVSRPAFRGPSHQQAFGGLSGAPDNPVVAGTVDFQFYAFAPALFVHVAGHVRRIA